MEGQNQQWIDSGYVKVRGDCKKVSIDISEFFEKSEGSIKAQNFCTCGSFEFSEKELDFPEKLFFWTCTNDCIEITEYNLVGIESSLFILNIVGVQFSHKNVYIFHSDQFLYLVFGVSINLVVIAFKINSKNSNLSILSSLNSKNISKRLKIFNIQSEQFFGHFDDTLNNFIFCDSRTQFQRLFRLCLPPDDPPIPYIYLNLNFDSLGFFTDIINTVQTCKSSSSTIIFFKFISQTDPYSIVWISKNGTICIVRANLHGKFNVSLHFKNGADKTKPFILNDLSASIIFNDNSGYISLNASSLDENKIFLFYFEISQSKIDLKLLKIIDPPPFTIVTELISNFVISVTNSSGIHTLYTLLNQQTSWHLIDAKITSSVNQTTESFYFNHIFSSYIPDEAVLRSSRSFFNYSFPQIFDRTVLHSLFENKKESLSPSSYIEELSLFSQSLEEISSLLERSAEYGAIFVKNDMIFVFIQGVGLKIYSKIDHTLSPIPRKLLVLVSPTIEEIISYLSTPLTNSDIQQILDEILSDQKIIESSFYQHFMSNISSNAPIEFHTKMFQTDFDHFESIIFKFIPLSENFIKESCPLKFSKNQNLMTSSFTEYIANKISRFAYERLQEILSIYVYFKIFKFVLQKGIFKNKRIKISKIDEMTEFTISVLRFFVFIIQLNNTQISFNKKWLSILEFLIHIIIHRQRIHTSCFEKIKSIFSLLFYDIRCYFPLIEACYFNEGRKVFRNLKNIYSGLKCLACFDHCEELINNLTFVHIILEIFSGDVNDAINLFFSFVHKPQLQTKCHQLFEHQHLAILSIVNTSYYLVTSSQFNDIILYILESVKLLKDDDLFQNIMMIKFRYKLFQKNYEDALNILTTNSLPISTTSHSIELFFDTIFKNNDDEILVELNYLNKQSKFYNFLYNSAIKTRELTEIDRYFNILVKFNIFRNLYYEASNTSFEAFVRLSNIFYNDFNITALYIGFKYLTITINCLPMVQPSNWQFLHRKSDRVFPIFSIFKIDGLLRYSDLKNLFLKTKCVLKLCSIPNLENSIISIDSEKSLINLLCKESMFELALSLACAISSNDSIDSVVRSTVNSCLENDSLSFDEFEKTKFFKWNGPFKIPQNRPKYDIWQWLKSFVESDVLNYSNVIINIASHFLHLNIDLPQWLLNFLQPYSNQLALLYLSHKLYIESSYILYNLVSNNLNNPDYPEPVSNHVIQNVIVTLQNHLKDSSNQLELNESEILRIKRLNDNYQRLMNILEIYQENIEFKKNKIF